MTHARDFHEQWMQDPAYRDAYEQLEPEFALARALIEARTKAGLTQEQLAEMSRLASGKSARASAGIEAASAATAMSTITALKA